jgi:hypothetical protein
MKTQYLFLKLFQKIHNQKLLSGVFLLVNRVIACYNECMFFGRKFLAIFFVLLSVVGYGFVVFAAPSLGSGGYVPGTELDPDCQPGDTAYDCKVMTLIATTAGTYTWLGNDAGQNNGSTDNTVFIGIGAGDGATDANFSNFIGTEAGIGAVNANNSNFLGQSSGCYATDAFDSNFFGFEAGCYAYRANNANFFGNRAGYHGEDAANSVFFGDSSGYYALNAAESVFVGSSSGYQAASADHSTFIGSSAGYQALNANNSNFLGFEAGSGADGADSSNLFGYRAGYNARGITDFLGATANVFGVGGGSNFIGSKAGYGAEGAVQSTFLGTEAGYQANLAGISTFIGYRAGYMTSYSSGTPLTGEGAYAAAFLGNEAGMDARNASDSTFIGYRAGKNATNATDSTFLGVLSGEGATNAVDSFFIGNQSGRTAVNAIQSIFIGDSAGKTATNATGSVFMGIQAGMEAPTARNSIFVGRNAGYGDTVNNQSTTITYSNRVGTFVFGEVVTGSVSGASSRVLSDTGSVLTVASSFAPFSTSDVITGTGSGATADVDSISQGSTSILIGEETDTGGFINSIALGAGATNTAANQFIIGSSISPVLTTKIIGNGLSQCTITTGTGMACSSDERLKTNINNLSTSILDSLTKVKSVTYNWNADPSGPLMIGFLAQDLEQYFPQLVMTDSSGYKSVYYSQMTPVLVEAIRELDLNIKSIQNFATAENKTFLNSLMSWLGDSANGIANIFSKKVTTEQICVKDDQGETCLSRSQLNQVLNSQNIVTPPVTPPEEEVMPPPQEEIVPPPEEEVVPPPEDPIPPVPEEPAIPTE